MCDIDQIRITGNPSIDLGMIGVGGALLTLAR
jgi:hypothetical protein